MAVNRDIVATRKLNKKNKARLGRGGDTKIREVDGRDSHVNALEAYLIDVDRKAGEDYAKRVGAGTTNPLTGMPEYHGKWGWSKKKHPGHHTVLEIMNPLEHIPTGGGETVMTNIESALGLESTVGKQYDKFTKDIMKMGIDTLAPEYRTGAGGEGKKDYDELSQMSPEDLESYLQTEFDIGEDSMKYIEGFQDEPLGFLGEQQALTTGRALETRGFTEKGLLATKEASAREADVAGRGVGETYRGARESLGRGFTAGSRGIGQSMTQARTGAETAAARSGFARSGTVTGAMGQQMKALTQDYGQLQEGYAGGIETAGRQADISRAGIAAGQKTAAETYGLGMEGAAADYSYATDVAGLDFRQAEYLEKQRQLDELYADVGAIPTKRY